MEIGDAVRVAMTKWGDLPHWEFDATYLGDDEHGDWLGIATGTPMRRPGVSFVTETDQVGLVPRPSSGGGGAWVATFHAPGYVVSTYVDMTGVPEWDEVGVRAIDLDLDVIRTADGHVFVDDEDEFAEHRVSFGYPDEVVDLARSSCDFVLASVREERAPFDDETTGRWFARLEDHLRD